jgi:hypothetical protein
MTMSGNGLSTRMNFFRLSLHWRLPRSLENAPYAVEMASIDVPTALGTCSFVLRALGSSIRATHSIGSSSGPENSSRIRPYTWFVHTSSTRSSSYLKTHQQAGFELHLGHEGRPCPNGAPDFAAPRSEANPIEDESWEDIDGIPAHLRPPAHSNYITVVDVTGVHFLTFNFCTCKDALPAYLQILNSRLFPATLQQPRTVFTFNVLDDFIRDNLECGTSGLNYFSKLRRITSNVFPHIVPVCT